jgi:hypothetical protein
MKIQIRKLKPVVFLLTMSLACVGIIFVVNQFKGYDEYVYPVQNAQAIFMIENTQDVLNNTESLTPMRVEESSEYSIVLSSTSGGSCNAINKIDSYSVCTRSGSVREDYKSGNRSGEMVSKNANITLSYVTVPLEFLSGSDVRDSNRKLTSKTPIYKPAGEQFDDRTANVLLPPGSNIQEEKEWVADRPFGLKYSLLFGQKPDTSAEEGHTVVNEKIVNQCEECNNLSNVNPDKSNKIAEFMLDSQYKTPGERSKTEPTKAIEECSSEDKFHDLDTGRIQDCTIDVITVAVNLVRRISDAVWNECTGPVKRDEEGRPLPRSENCIYVEDIIIKMASAFGSTKDCPDGICTNAYMTTRNKVAMSPTSASSYSDKVYYLTPCGVYINGRPFVVKCAWDMSHLFKERKFSELDDLPKIETTPSKEAYNEFLLQDAAKRSSQSAIEIF